MSDCLAYHITWTTYGTWLHGDSRGWVSEGEFGIQESDPERLQISSDALRTDPVELNPSQRIVVECAIRDSCNRRGWAIHALNVRSNHVHLVMTAPVHPDDVLKTLKYWCGRALSDQAGLVVGQNMTPHRSRKSWWTDHGSTKWINDDQYLENAIRYVENQ